MPLLRARKTLRLKRHGSMFKLDVSWLSVRNAMLTSVLGVGVTSGVIGCSLESGADGESVGASSAAISINTVTLESQSSQGQRGDADSVMPAISPNQRYIVFQTASNVLSP